MRKCSKSAKAVICFQTHVSFMNVLFLLRKGVLISPSQHWKEKVVCDVCFSSYQHQICSCFIASCSRLPRNFFVSRVRKKKMLLAYSLGKHHYATWSLLNKRFKLWNAWIAISVIVDFVVCANGRWCRQNMLT